MGNCVACCGESAETQLEIEPSGNAGTTKPDTIVTLTAEEMVKKYKPEMLDRLHKGFSVGLILQDKTRLECTVTLTGDNKAIELACNSRSRLVALSDIKNVLYTPEQLKRVDYSAGISTEDVCVALHLAESGNCIPLFFRSVDDRDCFVICLLYVRENPPAAGSAAPAK